MKDQELFSMFLDPKAEPLEIRKPIQLQNYIVYTDRNTVLYVPCDEIKDIKLDTISHKLTTSLDLINIKSTVSVSEIEAAISLYEKHECVVFKDCEICEGTGSIEVDFSHKSKCFDGIKIDCPQCDGDGCGDIDYISNLYNEQEDSVLFGNSYLNANFVERLILLAKYKELQYIDLLTSGAPKDPVIFGISEYRVLIMPMENQSTGKPFINIIPF